MRLLSRKVGGFQEWQSSMAVELWLRWQAEDALDPLGGAEQDEPKIRQRFLVREAELRALLTPDQQLTLESATREWIQAEWNRVACEFAKRDSRAPDGFSKGGGNPATFSSAQRASDLIDLLGPPPRPPSDSILIPGAYGMDAWSLRRTAVERFRTERPGEESPLEIPRTPKEWQFNIAQSWFFDLQFLAQ